MITRSEPSEQLTQHKGSAETRFQILHNFPAAELETLWRQHLDRMDCPAHYNAPEFFLEPYWEGLHPFAILAMEQGRVVAVLTGLHNGNEVVCGAPSRPQISIDKTADALAATDILAQGLISEAGNAKLITVFSWSWAPLPALEKRGYRRRELEGNVVLDLRPGSEALFDQFPKNRRRDIRAAIRNGIEVAEEITAEDVAEYWNVYSAWRKTERKEIHHNRSFAMIDKVRALRASHRRFLARYQGKVVAASGLRFCQGGLVELANNCSLDEYLKLLPNDLLVWHTIKWACEQGFTKYSLGGAHPFLRKWGETVVPIYRYRLDRTFLHRHDLKDDLAAIARRAFNSLPNEFKNRTRKLLRKSR